MSKRLTISLFALVALAVMILPASAAFNTVSAGGDIFIGEQGLDISAAVGSATQVAWFQSGTDPSKDVPNAVMTIGSASAFYVSPSDFVGKTGNWYQWTGASPAGTLAFNVKEPALDVKVWDNSVNKDITGKSIPVGSFGNFRVETNLYTIAARDASAETGFITLKVKTADGGVYTTLKTANTDKTLENLKVDSQLFYWIPVDSADGWNTGAVDVNNNRMYKAGVYTVYAECNVNSMKDNYKDPSGADYTGKTVSALKTVTIASDTVKLEASKDSVVRGNPFSVTITGVPSTEYYLWVKGTGSMTGSKDDQPPMILNSQSNVKQDPEDGGSYPIGGYVYEGGAGKTIKDDVPAAPYNGVKYYAQVKTSDKGVRTIEFQTTKDTKDKKYTIRVEKQSGNQFKSDEVDVKVEKGAVTIVASGDQNYFLGEEIKLSGTNSETSYSYLYITGPNLPSAGGQLTAPRTKVVDGQPATFTQADVQDDDTWEYKWQTANLEIDAGTYTIYAVSTANDKDNLNNAQYGTVSIVIKKPFLSAAPSQSVVAKGDKLYVRGTAEGKPSDGIAIWVLGKNKVLYATESVNDDATFEYKIDDATTKSLYSGQYFVVVQHPMYNNKFDIKPDSSTNPQAVVGTYPTDGSVKFKIAGPGSLQGSDAAEALVTALNDPMVDDTYTKTQFMIEEPKVVINKVGEKKVGDKFEITGTANLNEDNELLVDIVSSSFKPTDKTQSGEFSGATGTVKVVKGTDGLNKWTFPVDASNFKPDEYIVRVSGVTVDSTDTQSFNVVEFAGATTTSTASKGNKTAAAAPTAEATKAAATAEVTAVTTTAAATTVPTTVATTQAPATKATTVPPTPAPTQKSPGFGALVALAGLGAVAVLVLRRN